MPPESDNVNSRRERIEARRLRIRARRVQSRARLKESMGRLKLLGQAYKTYYVTDWKSITWLFATACPLGIAAGAMQAFYEKTGQFGFRIGFILCLTWAALLIIRYYLHGNAHFRKIKADLGLVDPPGARFVLAGTYGVFALVTLILKFADSSRLLLCVGVIFAWLVLNSAVINIAKKRATQAGSGHPVPR